MARHFQKTATLIAGLALLVGCSGTAALTARADADPIARPEPTIDRLVAFARLYGYVRYFHPADEAAATDWDRFAIHGVEQVLAAQGPAQFHDTMAALFMPVSPGLQLYAQGSIPPPAPLVQAAADAPVVAWQHLGAGLGEFGTTYQSLRTHRAPRKLAGGEHGTLSRSIDATPYRGMRIRLTAALRAEVGDGDNRAQLYVTVSRDAGRPGGFFDNMKDRPVTTTGWVQARIEGPVANDATTISFGGLLHGQGTAWFDDFRLEVGPVSGPGAWRTLPLPDPDFEADGNSGGWTQASLGYDYFRDDQALAFAGKQSMRLRSISTWPPLFAARAQPGEAIDEALGAELSARMPLALYSDAGGTLPRSDRDAGPLMQALAAIDPKSLNASDRRLRLANVVIVWNLFQHFYPYFDVVDIDWQNQLRIALRSALADADADADAGQYLKTLRRLVAAAQDGHAGIGSPLSGPRYWPPIRTQWIEGALVVTRSLDDDGVKIGDVITGIDGVDAKTRLLDAEALISGSPQWRRTMAAGGLLLGDKDSPVALSLLRDRQPFDVTLARSHSGPVPMLSRAPIEELEPGIWYVDLRKPSSDALRTQLPTLAEAHGVIFDIRGYPGDGAWILKHLLSQAEQTDWMAVPQITRPDHVPPLAFKPLGWHLEPAAPQFAGKVAFLINADAISYAESILGYVEGLHLGEIVGSATAGANGNVRVVPLPGGYSASFTGMRVRKFDGSPLHRTGIQPTVPVEPTRAGIAAGRDEVLERALLIVRKP